MCSLEFGGIKKSEDKRLAGAALGSHTRREGHAEQAACLSMIEQGYATPVSHVDDAPESGGVRAMLKGRGPRSASRGEGTPVEKD